MNEKNKNTLSLSIVQQAIDAIAPFCTVIKFNAHEVLGNSRAAHCIIQRALIVHHLRYAKNMRLQALSAAVGITHASAINLLKFGQGKTLLRLRYYYVLITDLVFSQSGTARKKFAKEINEKYADLFVEQAQEA